MKENMKVLIADEMHESIVPLLLENNFDPSYRPAIDRKEILQIINGFDGLIIRSKTDVNKELIEKAPNLRFVARAGAGMDKLDIEYLESRGIKAINAPEGNRDALGEHTLGMLLSLLHKITNANDQIKRGHWNREINRGIELKDKTVGIYGVGNMGNAFAHKLQGLGCKVVGYDKYNRGYGNEIIGELTIEAFQSQVEILSIHIPLTSDTKHLFDRSYLQKFSNLKILINTARGKIVKTEDLIYLLREQQLLGACLDVLENEKIDQLNEEEKRVFDELVSFENVIITPHVGGWTYESYERINHVIINKLKEFVQSTLN
jgi:D-3-phosphoglycerate dehydrogenase